MWSYKRRCYKPFAISIGILSFPTFLPPSNNGMHADCTGVIEAKPIFEIAEAVGAESGGDSDDQELDMVGKGAALLFFLAGSTLTDLQ